MIHRHVLGLIVQFPRTGMKVGTGVRELPIGSLRLGVGNRETRDQSAIAEVPLEIPIANKGMPKATGPEVTFRVLAIAEGTQLRQMAMDLISPENVLKTKCWACRKNAQEISMYSCSDCEKNICNEGLSGVVMGHSRVLLPGLVLLVEDKDAWTTWWHSWGDTWGRRSADV